MSADPAPGRAILPNFVVIGAQRSGTTSLYRYLRAHPDVFMPRKEIHFFDRKWDRGVEWYETRFVDFAGQRAVGEATPRYLSDPIALDRMASVIPDARLVAILRDPVDRAYSHYWMGRAREREPRTFEEAVADEIAAGDAAASDGYLARGRYLPQLKAVCDRYPRGRLLVALFDDLRERPVETYSTVCRFLEIDDGFVPAEIGERVNRFVSFRSGWVRRIRHRLPKTLRIGRIVGRLNAVDQPYPPMEAVTRQRLRRFFRADNEALATWLGRDLSAWMDDG